MLDTSLIAPHRLELADRHRGFLNRLLSFARLSAPAAEELDLPDWFVATGGEVGVAGEAVALDGYEPQERLAVLGRSRGYVGPYGAEPFLAVLLGLPAVAIADELDEVARNDVRVASGFSAPADLRAAARDRRRRGGRSRRAATRPGGLARSRSRARPARR